MNTWKARDAQSIILVKALGCNSFSNLLIKKSAPMLTIGKPNAAQTPAMMNKVIGLGRMK